jgi:hypothetical protein
VRPLAAIYNRRGLDSHRSDEPAMTSDDQRKTGPTVLGRSARFWGVVSVLLFCFVPVLLVFGFMAVPERAWRAVFPWLTGLALAGLALSLPIASYLLAASGSRRAIEIARLVGQYLPRRQFFRFRLIPRRADLFGISAGYWVVFTFIMLIPALLAPGLVLVPGPRFFYYGFIIETPDGYRVIDAAEWSEDYQTSEVGKVECRHVDVHDCFSYPYRTAREVRVLISIYSGTASAGLLEELSPQIGALWDLSMEPRIESRCAVPGASQPRQTYAEFSVPDGPPRILWVGVVANLLIAGCVIAFACFFTWWFVTANDRRRLRRRWKALTRGACPICGYDIRYAPEHRCPECGEMWKPEEPRMLPRISTDRT